MSQHDEYPHMSPETLARLEYLRHSLDNDYNTRMIKIYWLTEHGFTIANILHLVGLDEAAFTEVTSSQDSDHR